MMFKVNKKFFLLIFTMVLISTCLKFTSSREELRENKINMKSNRVVFVDKSDFLNPEIINQKSEKINLIDNLAKVMAFKWAKTFYKSKRFTPLSFNKLSNKKMEFKEYLVVLSNKSGDSMVKRVCFRENENYGLVLEPNKNCKKFFSNKKEILKVNTKNQIVTEKKSLKKNLITISPKPNSVKDMHSDSFNSNSVDNNLSPLPNKSFGLNLMTKNENKEILIHDASLINLNSNSIKPNNSKSRDQVLSMEHVLGNSIKSKSVLKSSNKNKSFNNKIFESSVENKEKNFMNDPKLRINTGHVHFMNTDVSNKPDKLINNNSLTKLENNKKSVNPVNNGSKNGGNLIILSTGKSTLLTDVNIFKNDMDKNNDPSKIVNNKMKNSYPIINNYNEYNDLIPSDYDHLISDQSNNLNKLNKPKRKSSAKIIQSTGLAKKSTGKIINSQINSNKISSKKKKIEKSHKLNKPKRKSSAKIIQSTGLAKKSNGKIINSQINSNKISSNKKKIENSHKLNKPKRKSSAKIIQSTGLAKKSTGKIIISTNKLLTPNNAIIFKNNLNDLSLNSKLGTVIIEGDSVAQFETQGTEQITKNKNLYNITQNLNQNPSKSNNNLVKNKDTKKNKLNNKEEMNTKTNNIMMFNSLNYPTINNNETPLANASDRLKMMSFNNNSLMDNKITIIKTSNSNLNNKKLMQTFIYKKDEKKFLKKQKILKRKLNQ